MRGLVEDHLVELDVAQALAARGKGRGAHGISACQVDKAGGGKVLVIGEQQILRPGFLPDLAGRQTGRRLGDLVQGVVDRPVGQRRDQHALALAHPLVDQVRQHEGLAGAGRPLDQVHQVAGIRLGDCFGLRIVQPGGIGFFPTALVAGIIDLGMDIVAQQGQDDLAPAAGLIDIFEHIQIELAQIEHALVGDPALRVGAQPRQVAVFVAHFEVRFIVIVQRSLHGACFVWIAAMQDDQIALPEARLVRLAGQHQQPVAADLYQF